MAYTINLTDGAVFAVIPDGTVNTSSSMVLVGKNYAGYGEFLDENFIHLLENSSNSTAPSAPLTGQLWWDSTNTVMKVYNGSAWKVIGSATAAASAPTGNVTGALWFDTTNQQLNVWTGSAWLVVGPAYSSSEGKSGAFALSITDTSSATHIVTGIYAANNLVSIVSADSSFVPTAPYSTNFPTIFKGTTVTNTGATGGNIASSGNVYITADGNTTVNITSTGANVTGYTTVSGNITGGNLITSGTTGILSVNSITHTGTNAVGNIGSSSSYFNQVFATATTALYADVAERFAADEALAAGTVVELGGAAEITKSRQDLSDNVFGVISTRAAYLMNGGAGTDETHPPVAMTGRVPVQVIGQVSKGDRLVSAGNGIARAALPGEATAFNTIGRALADKTTDTVGLVEAIVTIK